MHASHLAYAKGQARQPMMTYGFWVGMHAAFLLNGRFYVFLRTDFRTRVYEERLMRNGSAIVGKLVCQVTSGTAGVMMFKSESGALA